MKEERNKELLERAGKVIPNGVYGHMSVGNQSPRTPQFYARAKGAYLWDYDGQRYIDYMCAFGPQLFGYGHEEIDAAFINQLREVDIATAPSARMVELAEAYAKQITHCDWSMFCKNGTDATSMALMVARHYRQKRKVLIASGAYHGATTWCSPVAHGTLPEDRAHFIHYEYNNAESLRAAVAEAGDDLAAIFATPHKHDIIATQEPPDLDYARAARAACDEHDALLILDDVRGGFRIARDCSWQAIDVAPDLSTWGKALANGHALSCLMGSDKAKAAASEIFVTGSFWMAAAPMAAALKTLELIQSTDYLEHTIAMGQALRNGLEGIAKETGLAISQSGPAQMPLIMINKEDGRRDMKLSLAFADQLLEHGILFHPYHNMFFSNAISDSDIDQTLSACQKVARAMGQ